MAPQFSLADLRRLADDTRAMLQRQEIPGTQEAQERHAEVVRLQRELRERVDKPVTFGVVGEFTVGKSLLLGSLLGKPDLLPVEDRKATGNITVLRLHQAPPSGDTDTGTTTTAEADGEPRNRRTTWAAPKAEVHYLTAAELSECVRSIMSDLAREVDEDHPELGAGHVLGDYDPFTDRRGWGPFDQWTTCLWPAAGPGAPPPEVDPVRISATHRAAATELCRIRDAVLSQSGLLGAERRVDTKLVRRALDHGTEERIPGVRPLPRIQPFTADEVETDAEALGRSFMLVKKVVYDVHVSPAHWDLHRLIAEHPLQFLDFPGIGGAGSYGRDSHLSRAELAEVHTTLVVLDARRPGSRGVEQFWGMLARDERGADVLAEAALVAANAFDRVLVPTLPDITLPRAELLRRSDSLNGIHVHAEKFVRGRENAVVLTSSVAAIHRYGLPYAELSQGTRDVIEDALNKLAEEAGSRWEGTAARFAEADPRGPWAGRLRDADEDGGIAALHRLIEHQLRANGAAQKLDRAEASRRKLWSALLALQFHVRQELDGTETDAAEYHELLLRIREYRLLLHELLSQLRELRGLPGPGTASARRPEPPGPDADGAPDGPADRGGPPRAVVRLPAPPGPAAAAAEVLKEIYDWAEWDQLMRRARADRKGLVTKSPDPDAMERPRKMLPGRTAAPAAAADSTADTSQGYITKFTALVTGRIAAEERRLEQWLGAWRTAWMDAFADLRSWFEEPATVSLLEEVLLTHLGDPAEAENRLSALWTALDPGFVVTKQAGEPPAGGQAAGEPVPADDPAERFPAQADHAMPWHHLMPDLDSVTESQERHPLTASQLRLYAADQGASLVTARLNRLLASRVDPLIAYYEEAAGFLPADDDIRPPDPEPPSADGTEPAGSPGGPDGPPGEDPGSGGTASPEDGGRPIDRLITSWRTL
ncbi:hypothetical protein [Streptomyces sp. CAU 1734]|uniref:hypothetical protein n=1 Tax=Streptomyces sp. CAU 1734 TaxID=3140360 RepID=UPI003261C7C9